MPTPWRRGVYDKVEFVVVEKDCVSDRGKTVSEEPTATINRMLRRSHARREYPSPTDAGYDSDDDESGDLTSKASMSKATMTTMIPTIAFPSGPPVMLITMTLGIQPTPTALADNDPTETVVVAIPPPPPSPHYNRGGHISQTTEHLLIAAGSIGATIIIVMIVLALYTIRKRGLTFSDVLRQGKQQMHRGPPPPPPPSRYYQDQKQPIDDEYVYQNNDTINPPQPAAINARSGSLSSKTRLQVLERSNSFTQPPTRDGNKSFYDDAPSPRANSHQRNASVTPSSPVLPLEGQRQSASTRNTRSLDGNDEALRYSDPQQQQPNMPAPPTFRQFLSNRPTISQRPGLSGAAAGGMASRFSWTNSNAPQTPHDPSRDTVAQPVGRDSFMTQRSSVPRFRTIDSWVNQQSTRVEEQKLKQQFRMTQSTTYSDDEVPEMPQIPEVPRNAFGITRQPSAASLARNGSKSGLVGRDIKAQRHDTMKTDLTAPVFKAHPGTEVRFSTRSAVPSEILDIGRENAAL